MTDIFSLQVFLVKFLQILFKVNLVSGHVDLFRVKMERELLHFGIHGI